MEKDNLEVRSDQERLGNQDGREWTENEVGKDGGIGTPGIIYLPSLVTDWRSNYPHGVSL